MQILNQGFKYPGKIPLKLSLLFFCKALIKQYIHLLGYYFILFL